MLISAGSALSTTMTSSWQLVLLWGVLVGIGTGAISMGFVATIATRWFEERRGAVTGVMTAARATGQLIFLPVIAEVTTRHGWRWASLVVAAAALSVVPLVLAFMRNSAIDGLRSGVRVPAFWLLAGSFAICGMTTMTAVRGRSRLCRLAIQALRLRQASPRGSGSGRRGHIR